MTVVRRDAIGLFIRTGGAVFRPGAVLGYGHAYRMDDGGLVEGDRIAARHTGGTPLARLKLADGTITRWHAEYGRTGNLQKAPDDAEWDAEGLRVFPRQDAPAPAPRVIETAGIESITGINNS